MPRLALTLTLALLEASSPPDYEQVIEIAPAPSEPEPSEPEPEPASVEPPAPSIPIPPPPPETIEVDPVNYRIVLAGDVLIGIGGVGFVLMGAGLVVHSDAKVQRDAQASATDPDLDAIAKQDQRLVVGNVSWLLRQDRSPTRRGADFGGSFMR